MTKIFNTRFAGLCGVIVLSFGLMLLFFGKIIFSLNTVFFTLSGDGIQSYYNTNYTILYDSSLVHTKSMNYPYGEVYLYVQPQLWVVAPVKLISRYFDISGYTIGIINSLMLFSIMLGAVFLYLLLQKTGLPVWISMLAGTGIAFLSPQIDRMQGHFTLSYVWAIPLLLYLLYLFHNSNRKTIYSILIGISLFLLVTLHIYFAAFYFTVLFMYLMVSVFSGKQHTAHHVFWKLGQFTIQFILPVIIYFLIFGYFNDPSGERTSKPYGFLLYIARPESVFLPLGMRYGAFLHHLRNFSYVQWEGMSYIGLTGVIGFFVILAGLFRKSEKTRSFLSVTDNHYLNILFWASLILLLYSFGLPFNLGLRSLVNYIGPLKQLRSLGRFTWLFYYVVNIVVIYRIWQWQQKKPRRSFVVFLALCMLFTDVYFYVKGRQNAMNNHYPAWYNTNINLPENKLISGIKPSDFQAIIPLPFYHMGSEHFSGGTVRCEMLAKSCLVSIKTGLPIMAIYSGRASLEQSAKNIAVVSEPYRRLQILNDCPNQKPFLIVSGKCKEMTKQEAELCNISTIVDSAGGFILYRLSYDSLANLYLKKAAQVRSLMSKMPENKLIGSDSLAAYIYRNFDDSMQIEGYAGNGVRIAGQSYFPLYDGWLYNDHHNKYSVSFWLNPIDRDQIAKTRLIVEILDGQGSVYSYLNVMCGEVIKTFDESWGLIEYSYEIKNPTDRMRINIYNNMISKNQSYLIDEVLVKPDSCDIFLRNSQTDMMNNRWYPVLKDDSSLHK